MKSALLLVTAFTAALSFAAPISCEGTEGYALETSADRKTATLTVKGKPVEFGDLSCSLFLPKGPKSKPILECKSKKMTVNSGYFTIIFIEVEGTDMKGFVSNSKAKKIADLECVGAL
mgnify:CR=1 FL=1